jgi:DNA-binding CsgD family transcriptional regulator
MASDAEPRDWTEGAQAMNILILNGQAFICEALGTVLRGLNSNGKVIELIPNSPPWRRHQGFSAFSDLREVTVSVIVLSEPEDTDIDNQTPGFTTAGADQSPVIFKHVGASKRELSESIRQPLLSEIGLTHRQLDVLRLMCQGKSNKAICRDLDLAEPTVKNHVTAILRALKVTKRNHCSPPKGIQKNEIAGSRRSNSKNLAI